LRGGAPDCNGGGWTKLLEPLIKLSAAILIGLAITHPMNVTRAIREVEFSILREVTNKRSWGNPVINLYREQGRLVGQKFFEF
jgi:hypothetical protein